MKKILLIIFISLYGINSFGQYCHEITLDSNIGGPNNIMETHIELYNSTTYKIICQRSDGASWISTGYLDLRIANAYGNSIGGVNYNNGDYEIIIYLPMSNLPFGQNKLYTFIQGQNGNPDIYTNVEEKTKDCPYILRIMSELDVPSQIIQGSLHNVNVEIKNQGGAFSNRKLRLRIEKESNVWETLKTLNSNDINAGQTKTFNFSNIAFNQDLGFYKIGVQYEKSDGTYAFIKGEPLSHTVKAIEIIGVADYLSLSDYNLSGLSVNGGTYNIDVSSNINWVISENKAWINISLSNGSDNNNFDIIISENNTTSSRSGTVTVSQDGGSLEKIISIEQEGQSVSCASSSNILTNSPVQEGATITLGLNLSPSSFDSQYSYSWTGPNGFSSSMRNPVLSTATLSMAGTYYVTASKAGCSPINKQISVTVNENIVCAPDNNLVEPPISITEGEALNVATSFLQSSHNSSYTFNWTGPNGFSASGRSVSVSSSASLNMAGTYNVVASKTGCPSQSTQIVVSVAEDCNEIGDLKTCDNMSLFPSSESCTPNLRFSPAFTVEANDFISGTGSIYIDNYDNVGSLELYNGNYNMTVTGDKIMTPGFTTVNVLTDLMGFDFSIDGMNTDCDGVLINGKFKLPKFKFSKSSVKTEFTGLYIGKIGTRLNADIEFNNIGVSKFKIETLKLSYKYDPIEIFEGEFKILLPLMYVDAHGGFYNGGINNIGGSFLVDGGVPIMTTGFSLVGGGFDVDNIVHPTKRLKLDIHANIAPVVYSNLLNAEIGAEYDFGGTFTGYGKLNFWGDEAAHLKLIVARTKLEFDAQAQFVQFNNHSLLTGRLIAEGYIDDNNNPKIEGGFFASLQLPPLNFYDSKIRKKLKKINYDDLAKDPLAEISTFVTFDYIAGKFKFPISLWCYHTHLPVYYHVEFSTPVTLDNIRISLNDKIISTYARKKIDNLQPPNKGSKEAIYQYFELNIASQYLLIENSPVNDFGFYLPNGEFVDATNVDNYNNIELSNNFEDNITTYIISSAIQGDYYIDIESNQNLIISSIQEPPFVEITDVNYNQTANTLTIKWNDSYKHGDAHINLYADTDLQGKNGVLLAENISENDLTDEITINCDDIATGIYYIYAIVSNDNYVMNAAYYNEQIKIKQVGSPNAPTNLNYTFDDDKIEFTWDKITESDINYVLYYTNDSSEISYMSNSIGNGDTSKIAFYDLEPGKFYSFMCVASNNEKESLPSNIVTFTWNTNSLNLLPYITNKDENQTAIIDKVFNYKINAYDNDGDILNYLLINAPTGMSINSNGNITWTPNNTQKGFYNFTVSVTDPYSGIDSLKINLITVSSEQNTADIYFDKYQYTGYDDIAKIIFEKIKFIDNNQIRIYSNSDQSGVTLELNKLNYNVHYSTFNFSETTSSGNTLQVSAGDTIWAEYTDSYPDTIIREFAYFTEFKSNFITGEVLCAGDSIQFVNKSTGSGMKYAWDFGDSEVSDKRHPKHAFNPAPGVGAVTFDVTLTITDDEGRSSTKTQTVSMYRKPLVDIGDNVEGCGFVNLDAQNIGSTYMWNTGKETQTVKLIADGTYNVAVTNKHGCINNDDVNVTIFPVPSPNFSIQQHICIDSEEIDLEGNYDNTGTFAGSGVNGFKFNPLNAGIGIHEISYTYINEHGCDATITKTIEVKPLPQPEFILFDYEICINDAINLSAIPSGGDFVGTGIDNGIFSGILAGAGTHIATYTYTDEFSCTNSVEQSITVYALPEVSFTGLQATYCTNNQNSELIGIPEGGVFSGQGIYENTFSPSVAGTGVHTITYTYIDPETDCENTATYQTTVNALPDVEISSPTENICEDNNSIQVIGSPINGTFSGNAVNPITGIFTPTEAEIGLNTISYTLTNLAGCPKTVSIDINVIERSNAYISGDNTICLGEEATLIGSGGEEFLWSTNETTSTINVSPVTTTEYSLTVSNSGMCEATNTHALEVNTAEHPIITQQGMLLSTATIANDYQWSLNDEEIQNANSQSYLATKFGAYFLTIWDDNNCIAFSDVINLEETTDFADLQGVESINILPNPNNGNFKIEFVLSQTKNIKLAIIDITGQVVKEISYDNLSNTSLQQIDISNNPAGLYILRIIIDNNIIIKKVVVK